MTWFRGTAALLLAAMAVTAHAGGRPDNSYRNWFGHFDGGYSFAQGDFDEVVDDDWYFSGGVTYWPERWSVGITFDVSYDDRDLSSGAVRRVNEELQALDPDNGTVSGGDVRTWDFSLNATWSPGGASPDGLYLVGGAGVAHVEARLTDVGLVYYPPFCDPWWWWCVPGGFGPGTFVEDEESGTNLSLNAGIGYSWDLGRGSMLFVEARYKWVDTDPEPSETIPLVVGVRW